MTDTTKRKRQPKGIPVGGQFAANQHDEAESDMVDDVPDEIDEMVDRIREGRGDYLAELDSLQGMAGLEGAELADQVRDQTGDYYAALEELGDLARSNTPEEPTGFWEGANDPILIGTDPLRYRRVISYVQSDNVKVTHPTRAQTAKSLEDRDGKKSKGEVRGIAIDGTNDGSYEVAAPEDGTPLVVLSQQGDNTLNVTGGRAVISAADRFRKTTVNVQEGAEVVLLAKEGSRVDVHAERGSRVVVVGFPGADGVVTGGGTVHVVQPEHVSHSVKNETTDGFLPKDESTPF